MTQMPAKKSKSFEELSNDDIALRGIEYANKKDAIKELEKQCKECRVPLEGYIDANGKKLINGSLYAVVSHADVDVHLKKTLRTGKVLLPEAIEVLRANGLDECIENVPTVREDRIEYFYEKGKITDELLSKIYKDKSTYAFSVELTDRYEAS